MLELSQEFGEYVPSPSKIDDAIRAVNNYFNTEPVEYIGAGDNGIALRTADGGIIKYTIDNKEAALWSKLKGKAVSGLTKLQDIVQLSSSVGGDTYVYVIKADFVPHPLTHKQAQLVRQALRQARKDTSQELQSLRVKKASPETRYKRRTNHLVRAFSEISQIDPAFAEVPEMLMDMADQQQAYLYDLEPSNFRRDDDGTIYLVDPSVPDLTGPSHPPSKLMYEHKLDLLNAKKIIF